MVLVMYCWQLQSILSRFAARFGHTNHSLAICAMREPPLPRLMYDFGLIFVEHVRRKCTGVCVYVGVCECVCGTFKICSYRYDCATHRAHKCTRESPEQPEKNAKETKTKMNKNKTKRSATKIKSSLDLDREWATPDALLKTINRFDIERAAGRLKDTKIHRIALHCIAEQCAAECNVAK